MPNTYFDNYLDLFQHPGWKQFVAENKDVFDSLSYDGCKELADFITIREARNSLSRVIHFEDYITMSLKQLEDQDNDPV